MNGIMKKILSIAVFVLICLVLIQFTYHILPQKDYDALALKSMEKDGYGEPVFYHLMASEAVWKESEGIMPEGKQDLLSVYEDGEYFVVDYFPAKTVAFSGNVKVRDYELNRRWYFEKKTGKILVQEQNFKLGSAENASEVTSVLENGFAAEQKVLWRYVSDLEYRPFYFGLVPAAVCEDLTDGYEVLFQQNADAAVMADEAVFMVYCEPGKS